VTTEVRAPSPAWGHGRALLLEAARALFAEKGYARASTKEIARRARVTEPMLFRHFGTKAKLFSEAVLAPFHDYMAGYVADWEARPHGVLSPMQEAREFYRGLYAVLAANRELVQALVAAQVAQGPLAETDEDAPRLGVILERFEQVIARERDERGFHRFDPVVQARLMFGMALSLAVHGDWMFDGATGRRPGADEFVEAMARLTIHGAYDRPGHPSWEDDRPIDRPIDRPGEIGVGT
jgi:AcrR family transcriptional regulator